MISDRWGGGAQMVEHLLRMREAQGPTPRAYTPCNKQAPMKLKGKSGRKAMRSGMPHRLEWWAAKKSEEHMMVVAEMLMGVRRNRNIH